MDELLHNIVVDNCCTIKSAQVDFENVRSRFNSNLIE